MLGNDSFESKQLFTFAMLIRKRTTQSVWLKFEKALAGVIQHDSKWKKSLVAWYFVQVDDAVS